MKSAFAKFALGWNGPGQQRSRKRFLEIGFRPVDPLAFFSFTVLDFSDSVRDRCMMSSQHVAAAWSLPRIAWL